MAVFPESMNKFDYNDPSTALRTVEQYIGYMCERMEFAMTQMTRNVDKAGTSSTEMYIMLVELSNNLAAMQSSIGSFSGRISNLQAAVTDLTTRLDRDLQPLIDTTIPDLQTRLLAAEGNITSLDARVSALEGGNNGD